ncbi:DNA polymerase III subunit epsilon [Acinetobacter cumulans]|uniref:DNA polymerase III subunit epsilon n=1 Tax=Acinetobacter TaxID=469 RepID=UPI000D1304B3|nr:MULTISPECIES: DNA polymerase III subunit epsilon [Acinetobacter]QCO21579.1 DNA polymerase III subunit epsilon [Acinetobacter cumulans]RFS27838.1 DNA polymerase III subunit epsilon [Acinetobacter sp. SWAC5]RKG47776.1 DNA polymerase III subunit epsilon [Acinetobacter cumulans]
MAQSITLYVDGACKGNPGLGGWGAYIIGENAEEKICGGEAETTNNRMELTAAIEGILHCPTDAKLVIWTDSNYVKQGITEWIHGWKKKNWKDVKNPDLWKKLDATCQGRDIEWNWIKGHAGHPGNEMADQLANLGAENTALALKQAPATETKKKIEPDWLLNDPFGLDLGSDEEEPEDESEWEAEIEPPSEVVAVTETAPEAVQNDPALNTTEAPVSIQNTQPNNTLATTFSANSSSVILPAEGLHPMIMVTPPSIEAHGPRQLILDTETTGFYYQDGDRIIEVGAIEMINRKLTGSSIHIYIKPLKPVGDSENVHGISDDFLKDKPLYEEIAPALFEYLKGAEIIAHNASFDMNFLDMEFKRAGFPALSEVCAVTDTLAMAKAKHPGQKNSLDALSRRYEIVQRDRTFHGALLDAEILADVYLAMTGGQVSFDIDALTHTENAQSENSRQSIQIDLPVILPSAEELEAHENWIKQFEEKHGTPCLFAK